MPPPPNPDSSTATIVIVTKDRRDELLVAVRSAVRQSGPVHVLVVDDGSTDGSADAVRELFPEVRLIRHEKSAGYIPRRNEAARLAETEVVVSIDDDAELVDPSTIELTVGGFDDEIVGAVSLPYVDRLQGDTVLGGAPDTGGPYAAAQFRGTAYAVRRSLFLELGGFREDLIQQTEESDYCLRMLALGRVVRLGHTQPLVHHQSERRNPRRGWFYGARNEVLFAWHNVPLPEILGLVGKVVLNQLRLGWGVRRPLLFARALAAGLVRAVSTPGARRPVSRRTFALYRRLQVREAIPIDELRDELGRHAR